MATTLYHARVGAIDHKAYASLYNKTFDAIKVKSEKVPREGARFFSERTTNLETYREGEVHPQLPAPMRNEDSDRIPLLNPLEGYYQTWTNVERRSGFIVTERAITAQKTRAIAKMLTGLPNSAKRCEEMAYAKLFNGGFATDTGGDGTYLFATDHPYVDPQYGTWSNAAASGAGFTSATWFAAWLNLAQRKDARYNPDPMMPAECYFPVAMYEDVAKVHGSPKYPANALNAEQDDLFHDFKMVPGYWLTSSTQWYVHAKVDDADKGLVVVWETKPNYKPLSDGMNPDIIMGRRLKMAFSVGGLILKDWYANIGS